MSEDFEKKVNDAKDAVVDAAQDAFEDAKNNVDGAVDTAKGAVHDFADGASKKAAKASAANDGAQPAHQTKKKKWPIVLGVVAACLIAAGVGFWFWHETPGFCGTMCHTSMHTYVETYENEDNTQGVDKYGNTVENTHAMLVVSHKSEGVACLNCHVPSLQQQLGEVAETITGDYYYPLEEVDTEALMVNSNHAEGTGDQFCMNENCHSDKSRETLTSDLEARSWNPHRWQHGEIKCSECHKSHRASVMYCTQCHTEAAEGMPEGWLTYDEAKQLYDTAMTGEAA